MYKLFNILILIVILLSCNYISLDNNTYTLNNYYLDKNKDINRIEIPNIGLNEIFSFLSIKSKEINGIVLFKEYGRPNIENTNTIIGAHSGIGNNAYFNNIDKLEIGDIIKIYYERVYFTYVIVKKYQVMENDLSPLNQGEKKNLLTLMTCVKNNSKKRTIVVAERT